MRVWEFSQLDQLVLVLVLVLVHGPVSSGADIGSAEPAVDSSQGECRGRGL